MKTVRNAAGFAVLFFMALAGCARAALITWTGASDTNFSGTNNWSPAQVPGAGDVAYFNAGSYTYYPSITSAVALAGIRFGTGATGTAVSLSGSATLTLGTGTVDSAWCGIYSENTAGTNFINVSTVELAAAQTWSLTAGGTLDISNAVVASSGGAYALTNSGGGTLVLRGKNTFTGPLTVQGGGTLKAVPRASGDGSPLGGTGAAMSMNGGILSVAGTAGTAREPVQKGDVNYCSANVIALSHSGSSYVTNKLNRLIRDTTYGGAIYISGVANKGSAATDAVLVTDPAGSGMTTNANGYLPGYFISGASKLSGENVNMGQLAYDPASGFSVAPWLTSGFNSNDCASINGTFNTDTNCWALDASGNISGSGIINVHGGFVYCAYAGRSIANTLNFGSMPGVLASHYNGREGIFSGDFQGTAGIVKVGGSQSTITYASGTRSFTGNIYVLGGVLSFNTAGSLGVGANTVVINGGTLYNNAAATVGHPIVVGPAGGSYWLYGNAVLDQPVTGPGRLSIYSNGNGLTLQITSAGNTYSGGTVIAGRDGLNYSFPISFSSVSSLGTGGLTMGESGRSTVTLTLAGANNLASNAPVVFASTNLVIAMTSNATHQIGSLAAAPWTHALVVLGPPSAGTTILSAGNDNTSTEFGGSITNANTGAGRIGALTKVGTGTLTLSGTNTYTGPTIVSNGVLLVTGSLGPGSVTVAAGGILGGSGSIGGAVTNYGEITAGTNSTGTLTLSSNLVMQSGASIAWTMDATTNSTIHVSGTVSLGTGTTLKLYNSGAPAGRFGRFTLLTYTGADPSPGGWTLDYGVTGWRHVIPRIDASTNPKRICLDIVDPSKGSLFGFR